MPEFSKLSQFVDQPSLAKDTAFFLGQLEAIETAAVGTATKIKSAMSSFGGGGGNDAAAAAGTKKTMQDLQNLSLTAGNYAKILAAVGVEVDTLTDKQKENLRQINANFKAEEQLRAGAKETVKLIAGEVQQNEKLAAGRTALAQTLANNNAQLKSEKLERDRLAKVITAENNSIEKSQAIIDLLINKKKKLNLETEQGQRVNEAFNKTIERENAFILQNADAETKRIKNIGNYNAAANIVVAALEKERAKLVELEAQRAKYNNAGAKPIVGFSRGNTGNDTTSQANTGAGAYSNIGKEAEFSQQKVEELDNEITKSRVIIEGFARASKEIPIGEESKEAADQVKLLSSSLAILEREGLGTSDAADVLRGKIDQLTTGMQRTAAASTALDEINIQIAELTTKLGGVAKGSKEFDKLTAQINLLKAVGKGLDQNFSKSTKELRALEEAAKKVATEFGVGSKEFQRFSKIVGERKDQLKDVSNALKFQSSDTKGLDATLQGVQAITSAYGAYQAIAALTGEEDEQLAKSMQKLQAVTALVASVQGIVNALQSDSALIQGGLAVKTAALAFVNKILAGSTVATTAALTAETVSAEAATAAVTELSAAEGAATVGAGTVAAGAVAATAALGATAAAATAAAAGLEAGAVGAGALATGLEGAAAAEGAVAAGASTMATAIAATGIGLIIIGIAVAVYKVVTALKEQNAVTASVSKANEELLGTLKDLIDATKTYDDLFRASTNRQIADLEKLQAKRKALGVTSAQSLAMDLKLANAKLASSEKEVKMMGITEASLEKQNTAVLLSAGAVRAAEELKQKYLTDTKNKGDKNYDDNIKIFDATIEHQKKVFEGAKSAYDKDQEIYTTNLNNKQNQEILYNQSLKLAADERRKLVQESAKIEAELAISKNDFVLANERSTLDRRIVALKDNLEQQRKIIAADNAAVQSDPTASGADKSIAAKKASSQLIQVERDTNQKIEEMKEAFRLRDIAALKEFNSLYLQDVVKTNDAIAANDALTEQERLESLRKSITARRLLLENSFNVELANAGIGEADIKRIKETGYFEIENKKITNTELLRMITQYNSDQTDLARSGATELITISKDYFQKEEEERTKALRQIENDFNDRTAKDAQAYSKELIALNEAYTSKKIMADEYEKQKALLAAKYGKKTLEAEIDKVQKALDATKKAHEVEAQLVKELSDLKNFTGPQTDAEQKVRDDRIKAITAELELVKSVVGQESELYKQLAKLQADLSGGSVETFQTNHEKYIHSLERIQAVASAVLSGISGVLSAVGAREKAQIQDQIDQINTRQERELDANEKSGDSAEKKAERVLLINARAQAQKEQLEARQRRIDRDRAILEKNFTIFQIILATALNIARARGPFEKILAAISGAAQLAVAVATPIPKFKRGLFKDYIGPAVVGDGGKREIIFRKRTGAMEITPDKDTLVNIEKGDRIAPDADVVLRSIQTGAMADVIKHTETKPLTEKNYAALMAGALESNARQIVDAIKNKEALNMAVTERGIVAFWSHGSNTNRYIDEQTNWTV